MAGIADILTAFAGGAADTSANQLLIESAQSGDIAGVKEALKNGADIHFNGDMAFRVAVKNGYREIGRLLVDAGIGPDVYVPIGREADAAATRHREYWAGRTEN